MTYMEAYGGYTESVATASPKTQKNTKLRHGGECDAQIDDQKALASPWN